MFGPLRQNAWKEVVKLKTKQKTTRTKAHKKNPKQTKKPKQTTKTQLNKQTKKTHQTKKPSHLWNWILVQKQNQGLFDTCPEAVSLKMLSVQIKNGFFVRVTDKKYISLGYFREWRKLCNKNILLFKKVSATISLVCCIWGDWHMVMFSKTKNFPPILACNIDRVF